MTAAAPKPNRSTAKKRKASEADQQAPPPGIEIKKKSPLFDRPQNYYAPTAISSMTKDELSEWRKDQRRKRNRESAAASRNKTRARIEELEGEVGAWKRMHREMEDKMRCMERHVRFLTQLNASLQGGGQPAQVVTAAPFPPPSSAALVSHPNSPPRSPPPSVSLPAPPSVSLPAISVPHAVIPAQYAALVPLAVTSSQTPPTASSSNHHATHPFPPLLSEPQDCAQVETRIAAAAAILPNDESREHLTPVSRQAVKITGAPNPDSSEENVERQQLSELPSRDSSVKDKEMGEEKSIVGCDAPVVEAVETVPTYVGLEQEKSVPSPTVQEDDSMPEALSLTNTSLDDADLLDLLVDLDSEFDPTILI